jgi:hypothetical protein
MAPFAAITTHCVDNYNTSSTYILRFFSAKWKSISKKNQEKQRKIKENIGKSRILWQIIAIKGLSSGSKNCPVRPASSINMKGLRGGACPLSCPA